jgi:hypothetical protein
MGEEEGLGIGDWALVQEKGRVHHGGHGGARRKAKSGKARMGGEALGTRHLALGKRDANAELRRGARAVKEKISTRRARRLDTEGHGVAVGTGLGTGHRGKRLARG